jgi:hypothetical protein
MDALAYADIDEAADFITAIPAVTVTDEMVERAVMTYWDALEHWAGIGLVRT